MNKKLFLCCIIAYVLRQKLPALNGRLWLMEGDLSINLSFLEVGIPMVKNKNVAWRRVLSFLLCMMMVFCTVPLIASAAADGAGITVLERSAPNLYVIKNISESRQPEKVKTGMSVIFFQYEKRAHACFGKKLIYDV